MNRPIGYVLGTFPQLSETFIENELNTMEVLGERVVVFSLYRPAEAIVGPTAIDPECLAYRPSKAALARDFLRWSLRRPLATSVNLWQALRTRSQNMLRGAWLAGWVATGLERADARHVHAHFAHDPACVGLAAARLTGLPFTFTVHAHDIYLRNRALALRALQADRVVTVCEYNITELLDRCQGLDRDHIELIYCGVDPETFQVGPPRAPRARLDVLSVGRLVGQKGFPDLIRAVAILKSEGVVVDCEIVGGGPLRTELEELVEQLGLADEVRFSGPLNPPEVSLRMRGCDLFVLACRIDEVGNRDSMPVVIKEAMASGVPVVSTSVVGVPEMVDDEVGRLARPNDPASLAAAMGELLRLTDAERRALGMQGRQRVIERFNLLHETAKLRDLIDRLQP